MSLEEETRRIPSCTEHMNILHLRCLSGFRRYGHIAFLFLLKIWETSSTKEYIFSNGKVKRADNCLYLHEADLSQIYSFINNINENETYKKQNKLMIKLQWYSICENSLRSSCSRNGSKLLLLPHALKGNPLWFTRRELAPFCFPLKLQLTVYRITW